MTQTKFKMRLSMRCSDESSHHVVCMWYSKWSITMSRRLINFWLSKKGLDKYRPLLGKQKRILGNLRSLRHLRHLYLTGYSAFFLFLVRAKHLTLRDLRSLESPRLRWENEIPRSLNPLRFFYAPPAQKDGRDLFIFERLSPRPKAIGTHCNNVIVCVLATCLHRNLGFMAMHQLEEQHSPVIAEPQWLAFHQPVHEDILSPLARYHNPCYRAFRISVLNPKNAKVLVRAPPKAWKIQARNQNSYSSRLRPNWSPK